MAPPLLPRAPLVMSAEVAMSMLDDVNTLRKCEARVWMRRDDRRTDLRHVLSALATGLAERQDERTLQSLFEQELSRVLPARSVRLREVPTRF